MSGVDWNNAPSWTTRLMKNKGAAIPNAWADDEFRALWINDRPEFGFTLDPGAWTLIERRPPPAWSGDGLPPAGIEIEAMLRKNNAGEYEWRRVKVVHGPIDGAEREVLVFDLETSRPAWVDEFRPIRTAEQIAAEEREKDAQALFEIIVPGGAWEHVNDCARNRYRAAIDAGFRKQATA